MTLADQPDRLSWLRQAGVLCLLALSLGAFVVVPVHARDIGESAIHSSGRIMSDGQYESRMVGVSPNVSVPDASKNERDVLRNQDSGFNCFAPRITGRDGVLPSRMVPINRECALRTDLACQSSLNVKGRHECGSLPVVLSAQLENSRGLIEITTASYIRAIDLPGGFFPTNYETIGNVGQKGGSECSNNAIVFVSADGLAPDEELDLAAKSFFCLLTSFGCLIVGTALLKGRR
jgi:hypothetical protein